MSHTQLIEALKASYHVIEPGQEVEIGLFKPEDALGVALAYYEIYGESFPIKHIYDPEEITRLNKTEDQYTVVAKTLRGEVVGLAGMFRNAPNPDIYEGGQIMLIKSYRNSHIASALTKECFDILPERINLPYLFGEAVCNNAATQRFSQTIGMSATGLEIECMPTETYLKEKAVERAVSLLTLFKPFKRPVCEACLPIEYKEFIENLYFELDVERTRIEGRTCVGVTEKSDFLLPDNSLARITVTKAGTDFEKILEDTETAVTEKGLVQIYLNLGDTSVPEVVSMLRKKGYCTGGLLPYWFGSDGLIMQRLPQNPDWDALRLYGKKAKAIRDYVKKDYNAVKGL